MKKILLLSIICLVVFPIQAQSARNTANKKGANKTQSVYVDLGLPSGTKWKSRNEKGFYTYDEAVLKYGNGLPSKEQLTELRMACQWSWTGEGYKVTGPNGNFIILPSEGNRRCDGGVYGVGKGGDFWSVTPYGTEGGWALCYNSNFVFVRYYDRCHGYSVRLVK